jgi:hypothetical protein
LYRDFSNYLSNAGDSIDPLRDHLSMSMQSEREMVKAKMEEDHNPAATSLPSAASAQSTHAYASAARCTRPAARQQQGMRVINLSRRFPPEDRVRTPVRFAEGRKRADHAPSIRSARQAIAMTTDHSPILTTEDRFQQMIAAAKAHTSEKSQNQ